MKWEGKEWSRDGLKELDVGARLYAPTGRLVTWLHCYACQQACCDRLEVHLLHACWHTMYACVYVCVRVCADMCLQVRL